MTPLTSQSAPARRGRALRRAGLVLAAVWAVAVVLSAIASWDRGGGFATSEQIAAAFSLATTRSWGWLGAAIAAYVAGVHLGLRAHRPVQIHYRPGRASAPTRNRLLPIVVVAAAIATLTVAVIQQRQHHDSARDVAPTRPPGPVFSLPVTSTPPAPAPSAPAAPITCAPFEPASPPSLQPVPVTDTPANTLTARDTTPGTGHTAAAGDTITVHYTAYLCSTGHQVDRATTQTATFHLNSELIQGWSMGIPGMKTGGRRQLVVPPDLAYGPAGHPPSIPPNETMVFVIELLDAQPAHIGTSTNPGPH